MEYTDKGKPILNRIKAVSTDNRITLKELAKKVDVVPGTMSNYAQQHSQPSLLLLHQIAEVLNVPVYLLLANKGGAKDSDK